tara:strand:+ start:2190 stop:4247 length:2058 start_codon:yes stop_codon:yes gene_type:complete
MNLFKKKNYIFSDINSLKGVGKIIKGYLKKKKIEKINDLLWNLPYSSTDRSNLVSLDKLEIGKIFTCKVKVKKYSFPRIRNLPNKIHCEDDTGKIDLIYFNSKEGYLKKILPVGSWVVISGKINFYKNKYQMTNPDYVTTLEKIEYVKKNIPKYSLTEGISEKIYRKLIERVLSEMPAIEEWYDNEFIINNNLKNWNDSIKELHNLDNEKNLKSSSYRRIVFDEIISNLVVLSYNRKQIKKLKKEPKQFNKKYDALIQNNFNFTLTAGQKKIIEEINSDLKSSKKMFRLLQGDVGSGKTIISLITAANTIESNYQCALMAPTDILAKQHFNLCVKLFKNTSIKVNYLSGKTELKDKKNILRDLEKGKIDFIIGTHSLFQTKIKFKNLGYIIIDEQHKFGVKQRMHLSKKGGKNCDILLMSATPIPRTMMLTVYGDMDISKLTDKPTLRKKIITISKPENKIHEITDFIKKLIKEKNQIFWVCPLIEESKYFDLTPVTKRFDYINKNFPGKVGLLHGSISKDEKEKILKKFLNNKIDILISTTVIEVGIDFPNANLIVIENADKFGLAQLHQLRGRVGRGKRQGVCILLFKKNLSKNSIKRIKILKNSNDGFVIAEHDMQLRGFGDLIGFQQSGEKFFKFADPVIHKDIFLLAENYMSKIDSKNEDLTKFNFLLKLYDKAEIIRTK